MNLICLDFDGVVFDDRRFKKEYESLFRRAGIARDVYEKTYQESKKKGHYDPRAHIRLALGSVPNVAGAQKNLYARVMKFLDQSALPECPRAAIPSWESTLLGLPVFSASPARIPPPPSPSIPKLSKRRTSSLSSASCSISPSVGSRLA